MRVVIVATNETVETSTIHTPIIWIEAAVVLGNGGRGFEKTYTTPIELEVGVDTHLKETSNTCPEINIPGAKDRDISIDIVVESGIVRHDYAPIAIQEDSEVSRALEVVEDLEVGRVCGITELYGNTRRTVALPTSSKDVSGAYAFDHKACEQHDAQHHGDGGFPSQHADSRDTTQIPCELGRGIWGFDSYAIHRDR